MKLFGGRFVFVYLFLLEPFLSLFFFLFYFPFPFFLFSFSDLFQTVAKEGESERSRVEGFGAPFGEALVPFKMS